MVRSAEFISKMTEARPLKRYQSAKEALKDLETYFPDLDTLIQKNNRARINLSNSQQKLVTAKREQRKQTLSGKETELKRNIRNSEEDTIILDLSKSQSSSKKKNPKVAAGFNQQQNGSNNFEDTMIVTPSHNDSSPIKSLELTSEPEVSSDPKSNKVLDPEFVQLCHQELAYFIGPMASLIVEETLSYNNSFSPASFVETLAQQIPNAELRTKFKQRLL